MPHSFAGSRDISRDIALGPYNQLLPFKPPLFWFNTVHIALCCFIIYELWAKPSVFDVYNMPEQKDVSDAHRQPLRERCDSVTYRNYLTRLSTIWCHAPFRRAEQVQRILLEGREGFFLPLWATEGAYQTTDGQTAEFPLVRNSLFLHCSPIGTWLQAQKPLSLCWRVHYNRKSHVPTSKTLAISGSPGLCWSF